jgi:hypothetical protein
MPRRSSKKPTDAQENAEQPASQSADAPAPADPAHPLNGKNPAAVALGRLGGKKGGEARAKKLTAEQRREIAKKAAAARWKKKKKSG